MSSLRQYATPLTIGSFVMMSVTGGLMFFHWDTGLNKVAHEWLGWAMVAAVALHVVLNWRAFTLYFKRPLAMGLMGVFVVALGLSFVIPAPQKGGGRPEFGVAQMVVNAPVSTLAPMLGTDVDGVIAKLAAQDVQATPDQSLAELAGGETVKASALLVALQK